MGRRATAEQLLAQAEANGYKKGAHKQRDRIKHRGKHAKKTVKDQNATLQRYILWHLIEMRHDAAERHMALPTEEMAHERWLHPGIEAPDLTTVKDFLRFYIATSRPVLTDVPAADSFEKTFEAFIIRGGSQNWQHRISQIR